MENCHLSDGPHPPCEVVVDGDKLRCQVQESNLRTKAALRAALVTVHTRELLAVRQTLF